MTEIIANQKCYHCGEDCQEDTIHFDDKSFCCQGCQTVYDILNGSGMCQYYNLEQNPGIQLKASYQEIKFNYLDHPDLASKLLDFVEGNLRKVTLYIPAIHCSSCIWLLENLHKLKPGILSAHVQFLKKQLTITYENDQVTLRQVVELLSAVGYEPEISLAQTQNKPRKKDRSLAIKIGLAGFCFGNTMLLSLPEYLDAQFDLGQQYQTFFGYISIFLALPVFLYAASDYFSSAWKGIRHRFINIDVPIALGILALFGRSTYEIIAQVGPGYMDSLTGLVFFLLIGKWYQGKTYHALSYDRDYASYFPIAVTKMDQGRELSLPLKDVTVGDQILIRNQELIPADAVLVSGEANIDYSFVTGESVPVHKQQGDLLYAGGRQLGHTLTIETQRPVSNSYLTELWNQEVFDKKKESGLNTLINVVSRYFTLAILLIGLITAAYWYWADSSLVANTLTSVLIVACPCALALSLPFTFGHTMRVFGKHGLYLKNAEAIEKLSQITDVVFDKTGTITQAKPQNLQLVGSPLSNEEKRIIKSVTRNSTHPLSKSIYQSLDDSVALVPTELFEEVPGQGITALVLGRSVRLGSAFFVGSKDQNTEKTTRVYIKIGNQVKGYYAFENMYRPGFDPLMRKLQGHYTRHMLSGDNDRERKRLKPYFEFLHFNQSPLDKLEYLQAIEKAEGGSMMVGDGLNDAGALRQATIGVAVADNIYHFSPACDAILDAKYFDRLQRYLAFAKRSMGIVKAAFAFSFFYNIIGLSFAVSGMLTPLIAAILMPISSISVVGFITLAVNWSARHYFGSDPMVSDKPDSQNMT